MKIVFVVTEYYTYRLVEIVIELLLFCLIITVLKNYYYLLNALQLLTRIYFYLDLRELLRGRASLGICNCAKSKCNHIDIVFFIFKVD